MQFELTPEIIDQIIFAMENQTEKMVFDTEEKETLEENGLPLPLDSNRYVDIPEWNSFKGFQLMERFVAGLRNPEYREALRGALSKGKGVFRQFKDVIKRNEQVERLWYAFKEKEMKREVKEWYSALLELWGCEDLDIDLEFAEDTEDIIIEDFVFDTAVYDIGLEKLMEYDKIAFFESHRDRDPDWVREMYTLRLKELSKMDAPESLFLITRSPAGDFAGFIWAVVVNPSIIKLEQLYILPEYRGLGLAKALLNAFFTETAEKGQYRIDINLYGNGLSLSNFIERQGSELLSKGYVLDIGKWRPTGAL